MHKQTNTAVVCWPLFEFEAPLTFPLLSNHFALLYYTLSFFSLGFWLLFGFFVIFSHFLYYLFSILYIENKYLLLFLLFIAVLLKIALYHRSLFCFYYSLQFIKTFSLCIDFPFIIIRFFLSFQFFVFSIFLFRFTRVLFWISFDENQASDCYSCDPFTGRCTQEHYGAIQLQKQQHHQNKNISMKGKSDKEGKKKKPI